MAQNQRLMQDYDDRYREVVVDGLGLPADPQASTLSPTAAESENTGPESRQVPTPSQLDLQNRLSLINEERDDEQSSTDNQNRGRNGDGQ